jgi:hypothetical protein
MLSFQPKALGSLRLNVLVFLGAMLLSGCKADGNPATEASTAGTELQTPFDSARWAVKEGKEYPFREEMLQALVYTDTLRRLYKSDILDLLGAPDRSSDGHLFYLVAQTQLGPWPLHSRFMVIKLTPGDSVEWIKIHE